MKKLILASFLLLACGIAHADSDGGLIGGGRGWYSTHIATSGSVFTGSGEIGGIYLSSGPSTSTQFAVGLDTNATNSLPTNYTPDATQRVTPALVFQSTTTYTGNTGSVAGLSQGLDLTDGAGKGIRVTNGFYWFPSAIGSGEGLRAIIKWRR